ncbi:hypothetical protein ANN_12871 [Periplaneta americana]|uniref:Uncharacterized protein n=1 Tax=Periplaneta americana TaxID=6978 RepID=A0ABQ8TJZ4_PERAM|nr:hypothetical protein ANN_12871 [Periplaneta americana]
MSPWFNAESYSAFAVNGLRDNLGKNFNQRVVQYNHSETYKVGLTLSTKHGKGQLSVDMLDKLRDFSCKLTLFVSQFREGNVAYFRTIVTARDEAMLNDYVQILIEIQNEFNSRFQDLVLKSTPVK